MVIVMAIVIVFIEIASVIVKATIVPIIRGKIPTIVRTVILRRISIIIR